jgi:transcription elongation factor GreA
MDLTQPVLLTPDGLARLKQELEETNLRRGEAAGRLREASQPGDVEDNPEYEQAKEELARIDDRIYELQEMIGRAQLIEETGSPVAAPGSTVVVEGEEGDQSEYYLVGAVEADPGVGRISVESPVGRALVGHRPGDQVSVEVPEGTIKLKVKDVH